MLLPAGELSSAETFDFLSRVHRWMPQLLSLAPDRSEVRFWLAEELIELCAEVLALDYQRRLLLGELRRQLKRRGYLRINRARWAARARG